MKKANFPLLALLAALLLSLASCASLLGPRQVELPLSRLQAELSQRFPFNSRYLEVFDIYVSNPRLTLHPETNRVAILVDTVLAPPLLNRSFKGSLALSGALAVDPARNAVVLTDTRMDDFAIDGVENRTARQLIRIGGLLAEQMFREIPLYTFGPDDFRYAGTRFIPTGIATRTSGLVVTFEPA
ncbi:MAG: DUF1439 domain-containing protein [Noviherbaspirillum sp.]